MIVELCDCGIVLVIMFIFHLIHGFSNDIVKRNHCLAEQVDKYKHCMLQPPVIIVITQCSGNEATPPSPPLLPSLLPRPPLIYSDIISSFDSSGNLFRFLCLFLAFVCAYVCFYVYVFVFVCCYVCNLYVRMYVMSVLCMCVCMLLCLFICVSICCCLFCIYVCMLLCLHLYFLFT